MYIDIYSTFVIDQLKEDDDQLVHKMLGYSLGPESNFSDQ
jgi:hypothetical protein